MNFFPFFERVVSSFSSWILASLYIFSPKNVFSGIRISFGGFHCYADKVQTSHLELGSFLSVFSRWLDFLCLVPIAWKKVSFIHFTQTWLKFSLFSLPSQFLILTQFHLLQGIVFLLSSVILFLLFKNFQNSILRLHPSIYLCVLVYPSVHAPSLWPVFIECWLIQGTCSSV